ncbi:MAG TPA: BatA and WFA domain-containing protein [Symbiobacteriaceae bacterium]|nr:BatA and WFA domain-containing protein [Symbiobacteriaceae bacterium]
MGFLVPAALAFAAIIPGIVALYFLKLKRREKEISSTWLWRPILLDRQANSLWQKLRVSLLLLIQLLAALALVLAAGHPFATVNAMAAANTVILLDATGTMQATDVAPTRFAAAQAEARRIIGQMPSGGKMSLVLITRSPQILVANATGKEALRAALDGARPTAGDGDLGQAMALASSLLRGQEADGQIIIIGHGQYRGAGEIAPSAAPVTYIPVGVQAHNLAVSTFTTRLVEGRQVAFAQVSNYGPAESSATAEFWADGKLVAVERQTLGTGESRAYSWAVPEGARELEVRLPAPDALALDNRAWALAGGQQRSRILLVSEGNPFLLRALQLVPGATVTTVAPKDHAPGEHDLYVFDRVAAPEGKPPGRMLLIDPPGAAEERFVGDIIGKAGDPLLKYVETRDVHVNLAHVHTPGADARILWEGETEKGSIPLLWTEGGDRAVFAFALQQSDLPLRVAFPVLMQNLAGWLLPPAPVDVPLVQPGESVALRPWPTATRITVALPDGTDHAWEVTPGMAPPYLETTMPGLYQVAQKVGGGDRESRFAVNLFSSLVSDLTPAPELKVPLLPEAGAPRTGTPSDLWRWLGWAALALVGLEWWVYRRGY